MPANTGAFANMIAPGLRKVFFTDMDRAPYQLESIFNVETSGKNYEQDISMAGIGTMPELTEGAAVTYTDSSEGYKKTYTHVQYGLAFAVTRVMWEDDLYRVMPQYPRKLADSARIAAETAAANIFNNGFSSSYLGADAVALFSASHPLADGGNSTNTPSTQCDLSLSTLESAVTAFRAMKDDYSNKIVVPPKYLVVPAELQWTALKLVGSDKDPESANNTINVMRNRVQVVVWDYLTDTDAWFLLGEKSKHRLTWFWRKRPTMEHDDDFATGNALFKSTMRLSVGWSDWRNAYGTSGG